LTFIQRRPNSNNNYDNLYCAIKRPTAIAKRALKLFFILQRIISMIHELMNWYQSWTSCLLYLWYYSKRC